MLRVLSFVVAITLGCAATQSPQPGTTAPSGIADSGLLPTSEQLRVREDWLEQKHALLLPMMRKHGVAMWIIVNEEFHPDPLTEFIAPPRPYAGNRDLFLFVDAGEEGLKRYALVDYPEENLKRFFESPGEGGKQAQALAMLEARHAPKTIALSIAPRRGVTRSLTHVSYELLVKTLGPSAEPRFVSAAPLIEEYLDTRLPDERPHYDKLVALTDAIVRRAFSNEVITPGKTTVGDIRRFLYDEVWRHGVETWFQPDLRVQRRGMAAASARGFLAVASEDEVIQRGDLIHVDFGLTYMGLNSDFQRMGYVLREGETDAPEGLRKALANTMALQDALSHAARPGRSSAEVYEEAMTSMKARGIEAMIYSHPLGNQGHALGPAIDFRSAQRKDEPKALRPGSYLAVELNTATAVPEWDGQKVFVMEEDPAELTDEGYRFFAPRQEKFLLIR